MLPSLHKLTVSDISAPKRSLPEQTESELLDSYYDPTLPATLLPDFYGHTALDTLESRTIVKTSKALLFNIPDRVPTPGDPFSLSYPMLTRLRALLADRTTSANVEDIFKALQYYTAAKTGDPLRNMNLIWQGFTKPKFVLAMELIALLYRSKELFQPIKGDPTNALRFQTWHGLGPEQDDRKATYEYDYFSSVSAYIYGRILRGLPGVLLGMGKTQIAGAKAIQAALHRDVNDTHWLKA